MGIVRPLRPVPLRRRLLAIALASIAPLAVIAGLALWQVTDHQKQQAQQRSLEVTRMAATAIELELARSLNILQALAESPLLDKNEVQGYGDLIARILPLVPGWRSVIVSDTSGNVLLRITPKGRMPTGRMVDPASFTRLLETRLPVVGQLKQGPSGNWGVPLRIPVLRDGAIRYVLTAVMRPEMVLDVITMRRLPSGWVTTVLDEDGNRIARSLDHQRTLGAPASTTLRALIKANDGPEGTAVTSTIEGDAVPPRSRPVPTEPSPRTAAAWRCHCCWRCSPRWSPPAASTGRCGS